MEGGVLYGSVLGFYIKAEETVYSRQFQPLFPHANTSESLSLDLISLSPMIVPLLMEKLTNDDDFFALLAVDRLIRPEFVVTHEPGDPAVALGEQGRAIEIESQTMLLSRIPGPPR